MERKRDFVILENERIGVNTMRMVLGGATDDFTRPGQFVNVAVPGFTLRRPISVCDIKGDHLTIVYDVVGHGTAAMAQMCPGSSLNLLTALGNGFNPDCCGDYPLLIGGGVGCPPIYHLAKTLIAKGVTPTVVLGFNSEERIIMLPEFEALGVPLYISTVDGSAGTKGFVTDAIVQNDICADYFYACGPLPMLKALCLSLDMPGQVSLEARMGCGFGACVCCSLETRSGVKRICKEGPVFFKDDLIWK